MYQLVALFRQPTDPAAFDRAYWDTHIPLARKIPGVIALDISKFVPGKNVKTDYYQMAILSFADKDSFKTAMKSAENSEAGANLMTFAQGLVEFFTAEKISPEPPHVNIEERI